jgi:hypothetical protein
MLDIAVITPLKRIRITEMIFGVVICESSGFVCCL